MKKLRRVFISLFCFAMMAVNPAQAFASQEISELQGGMTEEVDYIVAVDENGNETKIYKTDEELMINPIQPYMHAGGWWRLNTGWPTLLVTDNNWLNANITIDFYASSVGTGDTIKVYYEYQNTTYGPLYVTKNIIATLYIPWDSGEYSLYAQATYNTDSDGVYYIICHD